MCFSRPVNLEFLKPGDFRFFVEKNREIWPKTREIPGICLIDKEHTIKSMGG